MANLDRAIVANQAKKQESMNKAAAAIRDSDTLEEAVEAYGTTQDVFLKAAKRYGMREELLNKFTGGKDVLTWRADQRTEALVEDAEWLARTGEHPDNAARRLGFKSTNSLEKRLHRVGAAGTMARLYANDGMGLQGEQGWRRP